jgi:large subunit ribosomal protein L35
VPKMKTHRGAAKRFRRSATGKIRRRKGFGQHYFEGRSQRRIRREKKMDVVSKADSKRIRRMLGV